jgi:hypothetical protein
MTIIVHFEIQSDKPKDKSGVNDGSFWVLVDGGLDTVFTRCRKAIERKAKEDRTVFNHCTVLPVDAYDVSSAEDEAFFALRFGDADSQFAIFQPAAFGIHAFQMLVGGDGMPEPFVTFVGFKPKWHPFTKENDHE